MELVCAIVLTFVTAVSCVPHGYGAIGGAGASAKAEANAAAGTFSGLGGLPLSIPNGAGFSGSFSKSSSSSFALSSASSSSGSFSFTGSGAGNIGTAGSNNLGTSTNGGCTTGGCKYGSVGVPNNSQLYNVANAGAAAQSGAVVGDTDYSKNGNQQPCAGDCVNLKPPSCKGFGCNDLSSSSNNCASGQCGTNLPLDNSPHKNLEMESIHNNNNANCANGKCGTNIQIASSSESGFNNNKCTSGKCTPTSQTSIPPSKPLLETEAPSGNDESDDISVGTTGPSFPKLKPESSYQSPIYGETSAPMTFSDSNPTFNTDFNQNKYAGASSSATSPTYNKPADYLSTPKLGPACTSPNCQPVNSKPGQTYLTPVNSDTNRPINNAYPNNPLENTNSPAIFNNNSPSTNYISPKGPTSCTSGNCGNYPSSQPTAFGDLESHDRKNSLNQGIPSVIANKPLVTNTPTYYQTNPESCTSGNCDNYPGSQSTGPYTSVPSIPGNPAVSTAEYSSPGSKYPIKPQGLFPNTGLNCGFGNCGNYPQSPITGIGNTVSTIPAYSQGNSPSKPQNCVSGKCSSYPSSISTEYKIPAHSHENPTETEKCVSGNCKVPSTQLSDYSPPGFNYPTTNQGIFPNTPVNCATGNCGNVPSTQSTDSNDAGYSSFPTQNCASGKCRTSPSITNENCGSGNCVNPSTQIINNNNKKPYFEGTNNPENLGHNNPSYPQKGTSNGSKSCVTGKCSNPNNSQESIPAFVPLQPNQPQYNSPNNKPINIYGSISNNDVSSNNGASSTSHSTGITANLNEKIPNSQKGPVYTGGFGGPPGLLKPNNYDLPPSGGFVPTSKDNENKPEATSNKPASCSSGTCVSQPGVGASNNNNNIPAISPETSTTIQSSQNDHGHLSTGINTAVTAISNAVAYSGGFGGPPGLLKPYDNGKISSGSVTKSPLGTNHIGPNKETHSFHDNKINAANTGFAAQAASFAGAAAGAFGSGNYDSSNRNKANHGCGGGCGSTGSGGYNSNFNFGLNSGLSKFGLLDDVHGGLSSATAAAKSAAGAVSGANAGAFGNAGSFASSSASAQASSGVITKGGYGR
ncbi:GATA zinc finger domain-containing protein 14-like [Galleria mellonella]|uniref:GATA zinc finger domain-containing protein 14-like n=1 Tax=Galleria mellonella TaxID=7137 RepID=A0A6J1WZX9_GALME|nr:GATA zinc finger domain-containing protein 14-like [Galleria mellonella]